MSDKNLNRDIAVKVSGVKKMYKLGQIGGGTLQKDLQSWWARVRGKEDPNTKIGEDQRSYGDTFMALNGVDLTIYQGEAVGIIGGNGAGKSTLLKLLSRVTAPTEGDIDIYGRIASMLEVGTGFNQELTGRENVYMNGAILGMTKAEIDAKIEDIIDFSEVREFIDTPVKRYSSGMFVKLAFSVAAHLDAEIMIMDEVLAVGDMAFQTKCLDKMRDVAKKDGRTVLYVSHNMNTIRKLCDRCIVLDKGKVVFEGDVGEAISVYNKVELTSNGSCDYSNVIRESWIEYDDIRLQNARICTKQGDEKNSINRDEIFNLEVCLLAKKKRENIGLLMEIRNEQDEPVGGITAYNLNLIKGENNFLIQFDLCQLVKAKYRCIYTIFSLRDNGDHVLEDNVQGIPFEILDIYANENTWNKTTMGYVQFPNGMVIKINC